MVGAYQLGIPQDAWVVGMLARVDPMKDYETYLAAARLLASRHPNLYFIAAGVGTDKAPWDSLPSRFLRLGVWKDVPGLLNALDLMVLSSAFGEGFPNVDAAYVIGDQGLSIPPHDPEALAQAVESLLDHLPSKEGIRGRILSHFSVSRMVDQTLQTLAKACIPS
ncbi:MAG: glycosyl transferase group 1 [Alphaproteobacteria bacterium]|nr:glycosyl transferase group 1 [Alphaproteobacteria bacterium]